MGSILSRIREIAEKEGITIGAIERQIGASKGVLSRALNNGTDIQSKWVQRIVENYPTYSTEWLLTGKGGILKEPATDNATISLPAGEKGVPLVSSAAVAGFGNADFAITEADIKEYYVIPRFKYYYKVDFLIEISGNSMSPHFNSGDIVACSIITDNTFLQWNRTHIIATREQGILCKRILQSSKEGYIRAVSNNADYPPFDIPFTEITGIALVCGVIRLE